MNEQTKKYIFIALATACILANLYERPGRALFIFIPILVFAVLHYAVLQRLFKSKFPFQQQSLPNGTYAPIGIYGLSVIFASLLFTIAGYAGLIKKASSIGPGLFVLLLTGSATFILLIFSRYFFAKPFKETWKAVLLAGIIAGTSSFALSYGLWKFVGPYLPVRTNKAQLSKI